MRDTLVYFQFVHKRTFQGEVQIFLLLYNTHHLRIFFGEVKSQYETGDIKVLKSNKLMEVLNKITTIISKQSTISSGDQYTYEFQYYFENNRLIITCHKITSNSNTTMNFKFIDNNSFNDFLKFLNQPINGSLNNSLTTFKNSQLRLIGDRNLLHLEVSLWVINVLQGVPWTNGEHRAELYQNANRYR